MQVLDCYLSQLVSCHNGFGRKVIYFNQTKMTDIINGTYQIPEVSDCSVSAIIQHFDNWNEPSPSQTYIYHHNTPNVFFFLLGQDVDLEADVILGIYHRSHHWTLVVRLSMCLRLLSWKLIKSTCILSAFISFHLFSCPTFTSYCKTM